MIGDAGSEQQPRADGGAPLPVGLKIGSTRTVLAYPTSDGSGLEVIRTLTCLASYENPITGETKYTYGDAAAAEYPESVEFPLRSGLPDTGPQLEAVKQFLDAVIESHALPEESFVVYAMPMTDNEEGQRNLRELIEGSAIGGAGIERYPESLCGSIPAFGSGLEAIETTFLALNLASTTLEMVAYDEGKQVFPYETSDVTGNEVDRQIATNVEHETQSRVNIDINTARQYKERHADFTAFEPVTDVIQQPGGGRHEFTIERSIMDPVEAYLDNVVRVFTETFLPSLSAQQPQLSNIVTNQPVVLTGGMACLPGITEEFERRVMEATETDIRAIKPARPDLAAAIGANRIATRLRR